MKKFKILLVIAFLLFTSTGVQSNSNNNNKLIKEETQYTIPEFIELNKAIQKQIELNNKLDSLTKNYK